MPRIVENMVTVVECADGVFTQQEATYVGVVLNSPIRFDLAQRKYVLVEGQHGRQDVATALEKKTGSVTHLPANSPRLPIKWLEAS